MPASTWSEPRRARRLAGAGALAVLLALAPPAAALDEEGCFDCHALAAFAVRDGGEVRRLALSGARYEASAHGPLGCRECHVDIASIPHGNAVRPVACGQACHGAQTSHEKIWWDQAASAHGTAPGGAVGCLVCHPAPAPAAERDRQAEARLCAACHRANPTVMAWFADTHGRALAAGDPRAPSCPDCHTAHSVRPASAEESSVSAGRLAATCSGGVLSRPGARGCHGTLSEATVAGASMNQLARGATRGGALRLAFSLLFAGMVAGLLVRAGIGFAKGR